jgi:hypothetical protein
VEVESRRSLFKANSSQAPPTGKGCTHIVAAQTEKGVRGGGIGIARVLESWNEEKKRGRKEKRDNCTDDDDDDDGLREKDEG